MKQLYLAGIVPEKMEEGGGYSVYLPDVPQVVAGGETIAEAIGNATSALDLALREGAEQGGALPEPSALADVRALVRAEREGDGLDCPEDTVYLYIPVPG